MPIYPDVPAATDSAVPCAMMLYMAALITKKYLDPVKVSLFGFMLGSLFAIIVYSLSLSSRWIFKVDIWTMTWTKITFVSNI